MTGEGAGALVIGVGAARGLGASLARRFAAGGLHVFAAARKAERLAERVAEIEAAGGRATALTADVRREEQVIALFDAVEAATGAPPRVVAFNPGANVRVPIAETETWLFEHLWRVGAFGAFLVAREAARRMVPAGGGTVIYTGATGSRRGAAGHAAFAAAKAGVRMIAESLAREHGPNGLHVAHVIVDGAIDGDMVRKGLPELAAARGPGNMLDPDAIAETCWHLHRQPPSAWTLELDLRPRREPF